VVIYAQSDRSTLIINAPTPSPHLARSRPPILTMTNEEQVYEVGFHIVPTVDEGRLQEVLGKIKEYLVEKSAKVISEDFPKLRPLAFNIAKEAQGNSQKYNKAYFGSLKFEVSNEAIPEINKAMKNDPEVLRFLIVKTVKENVVFYSKNQEATREEGSDKEVKPVKEMSTEDIDKSIEELVIT
jgi:ribosomal protein S6